MVLIAYALCSLVTLCVIGNFACLVLSFLEKFSTCQTVWIQIRTDMMSVLIWVHTVCKGYQETTKVAASKERIKCAAISLGLMSNC